MTYAKCDDCGSVGRHHYAHCRNGDQPRAYLGGSDAGDVAALVADQMHRAAPGEVVALPEGFDLASLRNVVPASDVKTAIADEAKAIVSGARRSAYGSPENNFERIARFWQAYFENTGRSVAITAADVSPMMRLMKEARLCETPDHRDSFVDLVGYALTGAEVNKVKSSA